MDNIAADTAITPPSGKIPLWIYVVFFSTLLIASISIGISQYQKHQAANSSQKQRTYVEVLEELLLAQKDLINANWLHTLNPLVKNVKGTLLWSSKVQRGVITLYNLPKLKDNQQYHLWVYDLSATNNEPVSALIFNSESENFSLPFEVKSKVETPFKFEVVLEEENLESGQSLLFAQP